MLFTAYYVVLLKVVIDTIYSVVMCIPVPSGDDPKFCNELIFEGYGDEQKTLCPYEMNLMWRKVDRLRVNITGGGVAFVGVICQSRYEKSGFGFFNKHGSRYVEIVNCKPGIMNTVYYYDEVNALTNWTVTWYSVVAFLPIHETQIMCTVIQKPGVYWRMKQLLPPIPDALQTTTVANVYKINSATVSYECDSKFLP